MSQLVPPRKEIYSRMPWVQLLAGPVIWSAHFLLSYLLVEAFCKLGWTFKLLGFNGLSFFLIAVTVLAIVGASWFALHSYRGWKRTNTDHNLRDEFRETSRWSESSLEFMYLSGFILSVLFTATMLMVGIPVFFLQPCS